jgi:hypothetical protein
MAMDGFQHQWQAGAKPFDRCGMQLGKLKVHSDNQEASSKTTAIAPQSTQRVTRETQNSTGRTLRAELTGSDVCTAEGFSAVGAAPVLMLCRKLVKAGFDPRTPLEAWRNRTLALRVRSIGEAALLEINSKGTGFVRHLSVRTASPVAKSRCGRA